MVKRLPDSELEIMMAIWSCEQPVTRMQIEEKLDREPKISATTVLSFLSRLEEKGFVTVTKEGKTNVYRARISKKEYLGEESKSILSRMYGSSLKNFVTACYDGKQVSRDEIQELQDFLDTFKK